LVALKFLVVFGGDPVCGCFSEISFLFISFWISLDNMGNGSVTEGDGD